MPKNLLSLSQIWNKKSREKGGELKTCEGRNRLSASGVEGFGLCETFPLGFDLVGRASTL